MVGKITVTIRRRTSNQKALRGLTGLKRELLIGIPKGNNDRNYQGDPGNATLLYIHEFGSPARNIPARPSLVPGVKATLPEARKRLKAAVIAQAKGDQNAVQNEMVAVGLIAVNNVRGIIQAKIPPPIADATKRWRLMRRGAYKRAGPAGQARMMAKWMAGEFTPLIDTGRMIRAITFVIRPGKPP